MSARGELAQYRIVYFATHGAFPGAIEAKNASRSLFDRAFLQKNNVAFPESNPSSGPWQANECRLDRFVQPSFSQIGKTALANSAESPRGVGRA